MTFTYKTTDVVSGRVLCDSLPLTVQSFARNLNGAGQLSGSLDLQAAAGGYIERILPRYKVNRPYLNALEPSRALLWVLDDDRYPVWAGVVWDWPDMSRTGGQLPITASTLESLFDRRLITANITYAQVDLFAAFIDLLNYGTSKTSPYIVPTSPTPPPSATVQAAAKVAQLQVPSGISATSGVSWSANYTYSDLQQISSVWQDMAQSGNLEYTFEPGLTTNGNLAIFLRLGYLQLGNPVASTGIALSYPGNVLDYGYQRTGSQSSDYVWATAPPNGAELTWISAYPHGADLAQLEAGYPLLETSVSWNGSWVTAQSQIDGFADGQLPILSAQMTCPVINIAGDGVTSPRLRDLTLGDSLSFAATSDLHPPLNQPGLQPGLQQVLRVTGWTCYPPDNGQNQYVQLATSAIGAS